MTYITNLAKGDPNDVQINISGKLEGDNNLSWNGTTLKSNSNIHVGDSLLLEDPVNGTKTVTLQAPDLSSDNSYSFILPKNNGTSNQVLSTGVTPGELIWVDQTAEGSSPTGPDFSIQFKNGSNFDGSSDLIWENDVSILEQTSFSSVLDTSKGDTLSVTQTSPYECKVVGKVLFVTYATSGEFVSYDISDPTNISELNSLANVAGNGLDIRGNYAYIAGNGKDLTIVNIKTMMLVSTLDTSGSVSIKVKVYGDYAFVAYDSAGVVKIINISNPVSPFIVSDISDTNSRLNNACGMYITDNYLYVTGSGTTSGNTNITIVDITDLEAAFVVGFYDGTTNSNAVQVCDIVVENDIAYVAGLTSNSFAMIDVSNPSSPTFLSKITSGTDVELTNPFAVIKHGDFVFVSSSVGGRVIKYNVSSGTPVKVVSSVSSLGFIRSLDIIGNHLYAVSNSPGNVYSFHLGGINAFTLNTKSAEIKDLNVGNLSVEDGVELKDTLSVGRNLYVGNDFKVVSSQLSVKDNSKLDLKSTIASGLNDIQNMVSRENYLYVANGGGMSIVDITDLSNPVIVNNSITFTTNAFDIKVIGNYAYVSALSGTDFTAVDISDPTNISVLGSYNDSGGAFYFYLASYGGYMYATRFGESQIDILDIRDPANIQLRGTFNTTGENSGITIRDNLAYIVTAAESPNDFLQVYSLNDPVSPTLVGSFGDSGFQGCQSIEVRGKYAYIACGDGDRLIIVDISDPGSMSKINHGFDFSTYGKGYSLSIKGDHLYLACYSEWQTHDGSIIKLDISDPTNIKLMDFFQGTRYNVGEFSANASVYTGEGFVAVGLRTQGGLELYKTNHSDMYELRTDTLKTEKLISTGESRFRRNVNFDSGATVSGNLNVGGVLVVKEFGTIKNDIAIEGSLKLSDLDQSHSVTIKANDTTTEDQTLVLPAAYGTGGSNYVLTDAAGNGNLSWVEASSGGTPGGTATGALQYRSAGGTFEADDNFLFTGGNILQITSDNSGIIDGLSAPTTEFQASNKGYIDEIKYTNTGIKSAVTHATVSTSSSWYGVSQKPGTYVVAAGSDGLYSSSDGISWTKQQTGFFGDVAYSDTLDLFAAVGEVSSNIYTSPDGVTWSPRTLPSGVTKVLSITWSGSQFIGGTHQDDDRLIFSSNGTSWTSVSIANHRSYSITHSPELDTTISVGADSYTNVIVKRTSGVLSYPSVTATIFLDVLWVSELSLFIAVGSQGIYTSPDGTTWTEAFNPAIGLFTILWDSDNKILITVLYATDTAYYSTDGINWETQTGLGTTEISARGGVYSPTDKKIVIAGTSNSNDKHTGVLTTFNNKGVKFKSGDAVVNMHIQSTTTDYTLTLPLDDGINGQALKTDGSGILSWGNTVDFVGGSSAGAIQYNDGSSGLDAVNTFSFNSGTGTLQVTSNNSGIVSGLATPTTDAQAATKGYVDSVALQGVSWKNPVIRASTVTDGNFVLAGENQTKEIDGLALSNFTVGERFLLKDQTSDAENGIYEITSTSGSGGAEIVFGLPSDISGAKASGTAVFVEEGTDNDNKGFIVTDVTGTDAFGSATSITWGQFTSTTVTPSGGDDAIQIASGSDFTGSSDFTYNLASKTLKLSDDDTGIITGLKDPSADNEAASKGYVDINRNYGFGITSQTQYSMGTQSTTWTSISYGNSTYVAVSNQNNSNKKVSTSTDGGSTWVTRVTANDDGRWNGIAWSESLGLFAAAGYDVGASPANQIMTSSNGVTWSLETTVYNGLYEGILWAGGTINKFVAMATGGIFDTSSNGTSWTTVDTEGNSFKKGTFSEDLNLIVCIRNGTPSVVTSTDAVTWVERNTSLDGTSNNDIIWVSSLNLFVIGGVHIATSSNGTSWTIRHTLSSGALNTLYFDPTSELIVGIKNSTTAYFSSDGINWTEKSTTVNGYDSVFSSTDGHAVTCAFSDQAYVIETENISSLITKKGPTSITLVPQSGADYTLELPIGTASAGQFLTDVAGDGVLSWADAGVDISGTSDDTELLFNSSDTITGSSDLTWDGTNLRLTNNKRVTLGASASSQLWMFHDGNDCAIRNNDGLLIIENQTANSSDILFKLATNDGSTGFVFRDSSSQDVFEINSDGKLLFTDNGAGSQKITLHAGDGSTAVTAHTLILPPNIGANDTFLKVVNNSTGELGWEAAGVDISGTSNDTEILFNSSDAITGSSDFKFDTSNSTFSVLNSKDPVLLDTTTSTYPQVRHISIKDHFAFCTSWNTTLTGTSLNVFDISNPNDIGEAISSLSGETGPSAYTRFVHSFIRGDYLYGSSASPENNVNIMDISDPYNVAKVVSFGFSSTLFTDSDINSPLGMDIKDNLLYIACSGSNKMVVYDISIKSNPVKIGAYTDVNLTNVKQIKIYKNLLLCAVNGEFIILDITDPIPVYVNRHTNALDYYGIDVSPDGKYTFLTAAATSDLIIYDITDPTSLGAPISTTNLGLGSFKKIKYYSERYLLGIANTTFFRIDISNISSPVIAGIITHSLASAEGFDIKGSNVIISGAALVKSLDIQGSEITTSVVGRLDSNFVNTGSLHAMNNSSFGGSLFIEDGIVVEKDIEANLIKTKNGLVLKDNTNGSINIKSPVDITETNDTYTLTLPASLGSGGSNYVLTDTVGDGILAWSTVSGAADNSELIVGSRNPGSPNTDTWSGVAWASSLSLFASVSHSGNVMTSTDGKTWTARTAAESNIWYDIAWAPSLTLFAAVSADGTNRVMTSPDGINWTTRTAAAANQWKAISWSENLGLFVAVSDSGTGTRSMSSSDGTTWSGTTDIVDNFWSDITWSPEQNKFVAVSFVSNHGATSSNGTTWTAQTLPSGQWQGVTWASGLSLFVAVANSGTNRAATSPDGVTWTPRTISTNAWDDVIWSEETSTLIAVSSGQIAKSSNGIDWTDITTPSGTWTAGAWSSSLNLFSVTANSGGGGDLTVTVEYISEFTTGLKVGTLLITDQGSDNTIQMSAPTLSTPYSLILPVDNGTVGQALLTDGDGVLSWGEAGASTDGSEFNIQYSDGSGGFGTSSDNIKLRVGPGGNGGVLNNDIINLTSGAGIRFGTHGTGNTGTEIYESGGSVLVNVLENNKNFGIRLGVSGTTGKFEVEDFSASTVFSVNKDGDIEARGSLLLYDDDQSNSVTIQAHGTTTQNQTWTLPPSYGSGGGNYALTDVAGDGILTWVEPSVDISGTSNNTELLFNSSDTITGSSDLTFDTSNSEFSVYNTKNPQTLQTNNSLFNPRAISFKDQYVFIGSRHNFLTVYDMTDPTNLQQVNQIGDGNFNTGDVDLSDQYYSIIKDNYLYTVSVEDSRFTVIDISDPENFTIGDIVYTTGVDTSNFQTVRHLILKGNYLLAFPTNKIQVIDITDPTVPFIYATYGTDSDISTVESSYLRGNNLIVVSGTKVVVLDVSNLSSITKIATTTITGATLLHGMDVSKNGKYIYISNRGTGTNSKILSVLYQDVIDNTGGSTAPHNSLEISSAGNNPRQVSLYSDRYLITTTDKIVRVDISDPSNMSISGFSASSLSNVLHNFIIKDNILMVTRTDNGWRTVDLFGSEIPNLKTGQLSSVNINSREIQTNKLIVTDSIDSYGDITSKNNIESGNMVINSNLTLKDSTNGTIHIKAPSDITATNDTYTLTLPVDKASAGQFLTDVAGDGILSWASAGGGGGDIVGPSGATDNAIARYDTTTGKLVQDSGVLIDDTNNITGIASLSLGDSSPINIGTGNDLTIVHDITNTLITNITGDLVIENTPDDKNIILKMGEAAGATSVSFQDSTSAEVASLNSNGVFNSTGLQFPNNSNSVSIGTTKTSGHLTIGSTIKTSDNLDIVTGAGSNSVIQMYAPSDASKFWFRLAQNSVHLAAGNAGTINIGDTLSGTDYTTTGDIKLGDHQTTGNIQLGNTSQTGKVNINTGINVNKGSVTQNVNVNTGVTLNNPSGKITTVSLNIPSHEFEEFTVTNSYCSATNIVLCNIIDYDGDFTVTCSIKDIGAGSFKIVLSNPSGGSLSAPATIGFMII